MVVGRGASDPDANSNVAKVTRMLWEGMGFGWAETAYSGVTFPLVAPGLEHAAKLGYRRIVVFPYFLFTGVLVQRIYDIADEVAAQAIPTSSSSRPPTSTTTRWCWKPSPTGSSEILDGSNNMNCELCKYRDTGAGLRGGGGPAAGEPPSSRRGHRHRRRTSRS